MKDLKEIVAKNITELRQSAKLTQLELGNAISYSDKAVSKWERGEAVPDAYVLLKLADIFGVTVDYILKEHAEGANIKAKKKVNHISVFLISIIPVWMIFAIAYTCVYMGGYNYPVLFMYSLIITMIISIVFNSIWGKPKHNMPLISALVVSIITSVYLIILFAGSNIWQILLLNIPAVAIVIACFNIKVRSLFSSNTKQKNNGQ